VEVSGRRAAASKKVGIQRRCRRGRKWIDDHRSDWYDLDKRETVVLQAFAGEADEKAQVVQPIAFGHQDQIDATIREVCVGHDASLSCRSGRASPQPSRSRTPPL